MGRFARFRRAFGFSSGFDVKVGNDDPGPHRITACSPGAADETAWGIVKNDVAVVKLENSKFQQKSTRLVDYLRCDIVGPAVVG